MSRNNEATPSVDATEQSADSVVVRKCLSSAASEPLTSSAQDDYTIREREARASLSRMSRETIRKQIARAKRTHEWRTNDKVAVSADPLTLRGRAKTSAEIDGGQPAGSDLDARWSALHGPGQQGTNLLRSRWETSTTNEAVYPRQTFASTPKKPVKRWWSVDALTATLIATKDLAERPLPYTNSTHYVLDTRRTQKELDHPTDPKMALSAETRPWLDVDQIRRSVSRESIANLGATRSQWERRQTAEDDDRGRQRRPQKPAAGPPAAYAAAYDHHQAASAVKRLSQAQESNLNIIQTDIQNLQRKEMELKLQQRPRQFDAQLEREKYLLICYLGQRSDVVKYMGLQIPESIAGRINDIIELAPKVELKVVEDRSPSAYLNRNSHTGSLLRSTVTSPMTDDYSLKSQTKLKNGGGGRYSKHSTPTQRAIGRKTYAHTNPPNDHSPAYENVSTVVVSPTADLDTDDQSYRSRGESIIAREIRELREREEELRQSRSDLGLPQLDDVIHFWRYGGTRRPMPPLRTQSMDRLHHLHHQQDQAKPTADDDTMARSMIVTEPRHVEKAASIDTADDFITVRTATLPMRSPRGGGWERTMAADGGADQSRKARRRSQYETYLDGYAARPASVVGDGQQQHRLSNTFDDREHRSSVRKRNQVPVEVRIEREANDLHEREQELKLRNAAVSPDVVAYRSTKPEWSEELTDLSETDSGTSSGQAVPGTTADFSQLHSHATATVASYSGHTGGYGGHTGSYGGDTGAQVTATCLTSSRAL